MQKQCNKHTSDDQNTLTLTPTPSRNAFVLLHTLARYCVLLYENLLDKKAQQCPTFSKTPAASQEHSLVNNLS